MRSPYKMREYRRIPSSVSTGPYRFLEPQQFPPEGQQQFQQSPPNAMRSPLAFNPANEGNRNVFGPPPVRPNFPPFGMPPPQFRPSGPGFPIPDATGPMPAGEEKPHLDFMAPNLSQYPPQHPHHPPGFPPFGHPMGTPPPFVMQPPPVLPQNLTFAQPWSLLGSVSAPAPTGVPPPLFNVELVKMMAAMDPRVILNACEWSEHISPGGTAYYYNSKTNESLWEKPAALFEFEEMQKSALIRVATASIEKLQEKPEETAKDGPKSKDTKKQSDSKKAEQKKCRPISSTPVAGTPWCVVWTGDKRVFFYNASTKQSVWNRPNDLIGRVDVDELVSNCPDKKQGKIKKAEATSTTSHQAEPEKVAAAPDNTKIEQKDAEDSVEKREVEDEEDPPPKKLKTENSAEEDSDSMSVIEVEGGKPVEKKEDDKSKIETKDALRDVNALEAEARAAKERAKYPLEVRLKQFRDMLIDKQVSAFSTWENELHKIVFDSRYLLLTSKERKVAFDDYVKERAEEERKEKKMRMKQEKKHFLEFLDEMQSQHFPMLSYNEFIQKYGRDDRFKAVEKSRDREAYFDEHTSELKRREREERARSKEKHMDKFLDFLKDKIFDYQLKWPDVRKRFEHDTRFSMLDSDEKEDLFRVHQKKLKSKAKARKKRKKEKSKEKAKLLKEKPQPEIPDDHESDGGTQTNKSESKLEEKDSKSEKIFEDISEEEEGCIDDFEDEDDSREERERKEREAASMREREKEVQRALAGHLRDRDKERDYYRHEEAVQEFQSLLTDLVRSSDVTWKDVKKAAKEDKRWSSVSILPKEEMEDLFLEQCEYISCKKKQRFRKLLDEAGVKLDSTWEEMKKKIKDDLRYVKFSSSEKKCEREFELYLKDKRSTMKTDFRDLLKETKTLTYRTKHQIKEAPHMMKDIEALLGKDKRYLIMDSMPEERQRLLEKYLDELERKGVPPPPTASEPLRRMKVQNSTLLNLM